MDIIKICQLYLLGIIDDENFERTSNIYNFSYGFGANNSTFHGDYNGQIGTWNRFLEIYFGEKFYTVSAEWYTQIISSDEFKNMEIYPSKDSIKIIQDAVVVKLKNEPAMP